MPNIFSPISQLDDQILLWLNQFMTRWPLFDGLVSWMLTATLIKFVPMVLVIFWLWFERSSRQVRNRQILVESVFTAVAALFIARAFAVLLPFRERPFARDDLNLVLTVDAELRTWSAFPSDHAVLAFALAASLYRVSPRIGVWAFVHATVIVCMPRLYMGLHHPSDLIGGGIIGVAIVIFVSRLNASRAMAGAVLVVEQKNPAMFYSVGFLLVFEISEMFTGLRTFAVPVFRALKQVLA